MTSSTRDIAYDLRYYQSNLEPNVEMSISIQDQQRIFLAYRALFEGNNAQIRQPKAIRNLLISSKTSSSPLVRSFGLDKVVSVLKGLLERKVFSSELKAKLAFPVLYETSPEQNARREASDVGAAKEEAEALQEVEALDKAVTDDHAAAVLEFDDTGFAEEGERPDAVNSFGDAVDADYPDAKQQPSTDIPSLYPVQFPFRVQHSILARSQKILEDCCYDFTQKYAANLLTERKWDCAEAIELNKWTLMMMKKHGKLPAGAFKDPDSGIQSVLLAVNSLRHSAVHRLRISAKGILQMIDAAVRFAETLSDAARASQLEELCKELQSMVKSQELNKNYLETKLRDELDEIKRQREELAKREQDAISTIVIEDNDNTLFVGSLIEGKLRCILDGDHADDELHESNPQDPLDNAGAEAIDGDPHKEGSPQKQGPTKVSSDEVGPSDEIEDEEIPYNPAKRGSTVNEEYKTTEQHEDDLAWKSRFQYAPLTLQNAAAKPQEEKTLSAEPTSIALQPEITADWLEVGIATGKDLPKKASISKKLKTKPRTKTEPPAEEPPKQAVQQVSIADIIQNILRVQEIDPALLGGKKRRSKKKAEMVRIKGAVSENLRHMVENVNVASIVSGQFRG
ncbi:MAG: hypothetical protein Q9196_002514 [Gyalolechia fulgens]